MKIKAAVLDRMGAATPYEKSKPLSIEDVELDPPGHGEVLVKVAAPILSSTAALIFIGQAPHFMLARTCEPSLASRPRCES